MARLPEIIRRNPVSQVAAQPAQTGMGFQALADLAKMGEDFVRPAAQEQAREAGEAAVYRDDTGVLRVDERSVLGGEMAEVHNSAAYAKYLAQKQIDVSETLTELAQQYQYDPAGYQAAAENYMRLQEEDENIPSVLREPLLASIREETSRRFMGLRESEITRTENDANRNTNAARSMLVDDYTALVLAGDEAGAAAKLAEIEAITNFRSSAPYIPDSEVEGQAYLEGVRGNASALRLQADILALDGQTSITDEARAEILDRLNNPDLDPAVRQRLYESTQSALKGVDAGAIVMGLTDTSFMSIIRRENMPAAAGRQVEIVDETGGAIRSLPVSDEFRSNLSSVVAPLGENIGVALVSGGQAPAGSGGPRTGSARHDVDRTGYSDTGDIVLTRDGVRVTPEEDPELYAQFLNRAAGVFSGVGHYAWGVHVGGGSVAAWGPDTTSATLDPTFAAAIEAGRAGLPVGEDAVARREGNAAGLRAIGAPITPTNEYLAWNLGVADAARVLSRSPDTLLSDIFTPETMTENPQYEGMTVSDIMNDAERAVTVKSSDIAAQQVQIDQIDDPEVRAMASAALNDRLDVRRRSENAVAAEYAERLESNDDTLTEQDILRDHRMSDQQQAALVRNLREARKGQIAVQQTVANLNNENYAWDMYDTSQRNAVDDAYAASIDGADPLTDANALANAYQIAGATGFVPKTMFNALRAAALSGDPARLAQAMEFAGRVIDENPTAIRAYSGRTDIENALSDYRLFAQFGTAEEAAAKVIELQQADTPRNITDAADDATERLRISDITSHFDDSMWSSPNAGNATEQAAMMAEYQALFRYQFLATGNDAVSRNRALDELGRIYGPNTVTGSRRIMKFPPQNFYPAVNGSQDWMGAQVESEVNALVLGDAARPEGNLVSGIVGTVVDIGGSDTWISRSQIRLVSDGATRAEIMNGQPPSYRLYYMQDGVLQEAPRRFAFDPSLARVDPSLAAANFEAERARKLQIEAEANARMDEMGSSTFIDGFTGGN